MRSILKVSLLKAAFTALLVAVGYRVAGPIGALVALTISLMLNAAALWWSDLATAPAEPIDTSQRPTSD